MRLQAFGAASMRGSGLRWLTARPIAHRGLHDAARPENTLGAFDAAIEARYAIECDVHISSDGVPVVFHDEDLDRLTPGSGPVRDLTAAELGELRVGGTGAWIPTLDEMLALVNGRVPIVIELKHVRGRDAGLAVTVVERLRRYAGPAAIMSFDPRLVAEVKWADPIIPRGLTAEGRLLTFPYHLQNLTRLNVDFLSYSVDDLPTPLPLFARNFLRIPLICWTVRDRETARKAAMWTDQITFEGFRP